MSFFSFLIKNKFPNKEVLRTLSSGPLTVSRAIFYIIFATLLVIIYIFLIKLNDQMLVTVPARGGTLAKGIIGAPRFINPILATTNTDIALTNLVFAGLMKELGDGTLVPELAQSYEISPDGKKYTFILRDKLTFHNKSPLTSEDIVFSIEKLQNPLLNSRDAQYWQKVSVSTQDKNTVIATLENPDTKFLQKMTIGIMSRNQWQDVSDEEFPNSPSNLAPIGSGAFKIKSIDTNELGAPKKVSLVRNGHYPLGAPLLSKLNIIVFANEAALLKAIKDKTIDFTMDISPQNILSEKLSTEITITNIPTINTVELFRRDGEPTLANPSLLAIINKSIDKTMVIDTVENGYGIPFGKTEGVSSEQDSPTPLEKTQSDLAKLGYTVKDGVLNKGGTPVVMGIATLNTTRLIATSRALSQQLATLGIISEVQPFDPGTFQDELNAAGFSFVLTDNTFKLPSNYSRGIPLYTITSLLVANPKTHGVSQKEIRALPLRYANAAEWHRQTDRVWKWLIRKDKQEQ